jgi:hypothetical protein
MITFFARSPPVVFSANPSAPRTVEVGCVRMWSSGAQGKVTLAVAFIGPSISPCAPPSPAESSGLLLHRCLSSVCFIFSSLLIQQSMLPFLLLAFV